MFNMILYVSVSIVIYSYFGYPLSLYLVSLITVKRNEKKTIHPQVTFIVAAYNEKERIKEKIENTLSVSYPKDKLEIIFASDGSTDGTNEIISSYAGKGIDFLLLPIRGGKEIAQREAVKKSRGEILVFFRCIDHARTLRHRADRIEFRGSSSRVRKQQGCGNRSGRKTWR